METDSTIIKKRGRKPKSPKLELVKVIKKRGRKPKIKDDESDDKPKIHKKRGRKPKPKIDEEVKIPKKRGRKPKDKYSVVDNVLNLNNNEEHIILHLPIKSKDLLNSELIENKLLRYNPEINVPKPYEPNKITSNIISPYPFNIEDPDIKTVSNKIEGDYISEKIETETNSKQSLTMNITEKDKNINKNYDEILDNLSTKREMDINISGTKTKNSVLLINFLDSNKKKIWPSSTNIDCFWCCHPFDGPPCGLPCKCVNDQFNVYGIFCSPECAAAYNFDNNTFNEMWEIYSLLNLLYRKVYNDKNIKIKLAAPKETLKIFGGSLSIKDFRMYNTNYSREFNIIKPPMISIIPQQEFKCVQNLNTSKKNLSISNFSEKDLRLKRSKPYIGSKNTLEKCMNLKCKK